MIEYLNDELKEVSDYLDGTTKIQKKKNIYIALAGGRGCGKSRLAALVGLWGLAYFSKIRCVVTISANTLDQIKRSTWVAMEEMHSKTLFKLLCKI